MAIEPREPYPRDPAFRTSDAAAEDPVPWSAVDAPVAPAQTTGSARSPVAEPAAMPATTVTTTPAAETPTAEAIDRQAALRALRNLEATEARLERNARREAEEMRGKLGQELLPGLDNLDPTILAPDAGRSDPAMVEGVRLVRQQLEGVLRGYGVERVEALGQRFDPALHEAIGMIAVREPQRHGEVVHQAEPGYRFAGRLLRPAKVSVGKL